MTEAHLELAEAKKRVLLERYLPNAQNLKKLPNNKDFGRTGDDLASGINQIPKGSLYVVIFSPHFLYFSTIFWGVWEVSFIFLDVPITHMVNMESLLIT